MRTWTNVVAAVCAVIFSPVRAEPASVCGIPHDSSSSSFFSIRSMT